MRHRYPVGAYVRFKDPDPEGRYSNGEPMGCLVLEQLASDLPQPQYLVLEGILDDERYHLIASEDELLDTGQRRW